MTNKSVNACLIERKITTNQNNYMATQVVTTVSILIRKSSQIRVTGILNGEKQFYILDSISGHSKSRLLPKRKVTPFKVRNKQNYNVYQKGTCVDFKMIMGMYNYFSEATKHINLSLDRLIEIEYIHMIAYLL